jgi:hypothetical protein
VHSDSKTQTLTYTADLPSKTVLAITTACILATLCTPKANAALNLSDNTRWAIDASSRYTDTTKANDHHEVFAQHVVGFDFYSKIVNHGRDVATIVFQPYWIELNNRVSPPSFFSDGNDGALNWRIANINYTGLSRGGFNIRAGHFEVPFGLEQNIDSNGTLRQFTASDRNIKADWGASINGVLPSIEYEIALTRGTGNNITNDSIDNTDPSITSGRIGTLSTLNTIWGFSFLDGDIVSGNNTVARRRIGIDWTHYYNHWEFISEISTGDNGDTDTNNAFFEIAWNNPSHNVKIYNQWQYRTRELNSTIDTRFFTLGSQWFITNKIDVSAAWLKTLADQSANNTSTVNIQFRIRL